MRNELYEDYFNHPSKSYWTCLMTWIVCFSGLIAPSRLNVASKREGSEADGKDKAFIFKKIWCHVAICHLILWLNLYVTSEYVYLWGITLVCICVIVFSSFALLIVISDNTCKYLKPSVLAAPKLSGATGFGSSHYDSPSSTFSSVNSFHIRPSVFSNPFESATSRSKNKT